MKKTDLYRLIDALPEKEIPTAAAFLSFVTHRAQQASTSDYLDMAPYDEDDYTEEDLLVIDGRIREAQEGTTITFAQVKAEHGL
ncbi:MAG: hypothetical protein WC314_27615 [Vulcanimicrobiota bacterium]